MAELKYCAICMADENEDGPIIEDLCQRHYKEFKGEDSVDEQGVPQFKSFEEMEAFLAKTNKTTKKTPSPGGSSKKKKGREPVDPAREFADGKSVWRTEHFYVRPGDTWESVMKDAREERKFRNENVLIFCHEHSFDEPCTDKCKEQI